MCGIAGVLRLDGAPVDCQDIKMMTDAIAHRGPDGEGQWCEGSIGLGHRRLAIIDLSSDAAQPMHSSDGRYVITYNGEVYNFRELRRDLEKSGSRFLSQSDTEVVLEAVIRWGIDAAIRRFNGMFAFVIWDRHEQCLLLGRDRYGIKPLYVWKTPQEIAVASETKALQSLPRFASTVDPHGVAEYLTFQNILSERTLLKNVWNFPPGHWATISTGAPRLDLTQYWDFCFAEQLAAVAEDEIAEELNRLVNQAVDRQLVGDVEVGSYLSGGLDSGLLVAMAARRVPELKTFTVGFEKTGFEGDADWFDERAAAEMISAHTGTTQFETVIGSRHVLPSMAFISHHLDEPRVGQSYPNHYAARLAKGFVKVALSGTGGDEVLGGYPWRYPALGTSPMEFRERHFKLWERLLDLETLVELIAPLAYGLSDFDPRQVHEAILNRATPSANDHSGLMSQSLYFEARTFLAGLLAVEDRLSMAQGLEVRVPFLDNDLVDFASRLPLTSRLSQTPATHQRQGEWAPQRTGKHILRRVAACYLPGEIVFARKRGFSGPDAVWFGSDLSRDLRSLVSHSNPTIVDPTVALRLLEDRNGRPDNRWRLLSWSLGMMAFQSWGLNGPK